MLALYGRMRDSWRKVGSVPGSVIKDRDRRSGRKEEGRGETGCQSRRADLVAVWHAILHNKRNSMYPDYIVQRRKPALTTDSW